MRVKRKIGILHVVFATLVATVASTASAADTFPQRAERLPTPGRNSVSEEGTDALVVNPANLGTMPSWQLRWTGVRCPDTRKVGCGHALGFATPLFFGLGTGLRFDYVSPPSGGRASPGFPYDNQDLFWVTWGLGYKLSDALSLGFAVQWAYSTSPYLNGLASVTSGITYRPAPALGMSFVFRDMNGPGQRGFFSNTPSFLDRSYEGTIAFRPTGTRAIEAGLELRYYEGLDDARPRATIGLDVPAVGRLRGDIEIANVGNEARRSFVASAGLEIAYGHVTGGGGLLFGNGLSGNDALGQYGTLAVGGYMEPGIPAIKHAVYIRIEKTPGTRSHVALLRSLWKLAEDPTIAAVGLVVRTEPATSFAHAEELADALRVLRARGKKTFCSFEDAGPKALFACASADRIVINPAGGIRYSGLKSQHMYFAKLLDNVGVKAEFVRIGAHKGAPEQFTNEGPSDVARADQQDLLAQQEAVFVRNLALYRHLDEKSIRENTRKGPFVATEARDAKFVDGFAYDDELDKVAKDVVGHRVSYSAYEPYRNVPKTFEKRGKVGVLYVEGDMVDGRSQTIPLLGMKLAGSYTIVDAIKRLRDDSDVRAVVLRIESPGGSTMASDLMWRELRKLGEKKPLIVSMGSVAASGGYYIATAGKQIYANPLTVTGSIGIFYGKADVSGLMKKIGVNVETHRTTPRADVESFYRPFTDDERGELTKKVGQFYDFFLGRVSEGRHMTKAEVDAVGQGRVWMGQQAIQHKLVDKMGGIRHALEAARAAGHLPDDAPIVEYPEVQSSLFDTVLKLAGFSADGTIAMLPPALKTAVRAVAPLAVMPESTAMARAEWISLDDEPTADE